MIKTFSKLLTLIFGKTPLRRFTTEEFLTYFFVGGFTTGLDFFLFWFLVDIIHIWYLFVQMVVSPLTLLLNYSLHKKITFASDRSHNKAVPRYIGLVIFNYLASLGMLYVFVDVFRFHPIIGKLFVYGVILLWNYSALKFIVFSKE